MVTLAHLAKIEATDVMGMDWMSRHERTERLATKRVRFTSMVVAELAPDQHILGTNTAKMASRVIALPDRQKRQASLLEFGFIKRARR